MFIVVGGDGFDGLFVRVGGIDLKTVQDYVNAKKELSEVGKLPEVGKEALQAAQDIAEKNSQQQLEPMHLLAALVAQPD